ncbi:MAG: hypothetical protein ACFB2W_27410 [Leptolyngbyaceae cyanobacterium]
MSTRNNFSIVDRKANNFSGNSSVRSNTNFGIDLLLVAASEQYAESESYSGSLASSVWF